MLSKGFSLWVIKIRRCVIRVTEEARTFENRASKLPYAYVPDSPATLYLSICLCEKEKRLVYLLAGQLCRRPDETKHEQIE